VHKDWMSQLEIFLDLADVAENIGYLGLKANNVALLKHDLNVLLVQSLQRPDYLVQCSNLMVYRLL
jgi:hypothetical protein